VSRGAERGVCRPVRMAIITLIMSTSITTINTEIQVDLPKGRNAAFERGEEIVRSAEYQATYIDP